VTFLRYSTDQFPTVTRGLYDWHHGKYRWDEPGMDHDPEPTGIRMLFLIVQMMIVNEPRKSTINVNDGPLWKEWYKTVTKWATGTL